MMDMTLFLCIVHCDKYHFLYCFYSQLNSFHCSNGVYHMEICKFHCKPGLEDSLFLFHHHLHFEKKLIFFLQHWHCDKLLSEYYLCLIFFSFRQAQAAVLEALPLLQQNDIPTKRPDDYFAEMVKSDEHMEKVCLILSVQKNSC